MASRTLLLLLALFVAGHAFSISNIAAINRRRIIAGVHPSDDRTRVSRWKCVLMAAASIPANSTADEQSSDNTTSSILLEKVLSQTAEGIGGEGGHVFDVNSLKRNLLQETMMAYKSELFQLLNSPRSVEQDIAEKLAALVEGSPVRTTTDSNLLDGKWALAYSSKHSTTKDLVNSADSNQQLRRTDGPKAPKTPAMKRIQGKGSLFFSVDKTFCLEHLSEDEEPYVVSKSTFWGGILAKESRYMVESLTRQSLQLRSHSKTTFLFGRPLRKDTKVKEQPTAELQIIYADVNLCISSFKEANSRTYEVYTKNEAWLDRRKSFERKLAFLIAGLVGCFLPFWKSNSGIERDPILSEIYADTPNLRVLKLGNSANEEEDAWDSASDPFVHLSADDRQRIMKAMSIGQIERAGIQGKSKYQRKRWTPRLFRRRKTFFKQPGEKKK